MSGKHLLNQLAPADYVSLLALVLSWFAIAMLLKQLMFASLGVAVLALIADMLDGFIARKSTIASSFGKYLDSFLDVVLYLIYPSLFLFLLGLSDIVSIIILAVFIAAGVLRLARFTAQGFEEERDQSYYVGMPVFWNLLWLYALALLAEQWPIYDFRYAVAAMLILVSWLMVSSIKFPKPASYSVLLSLLVIAALISIVLELTLRN